MEESIMMGIMTISLMSIGLVGGLTAAIRLSRGMDYIPHSDSFWHDATNESIMSHKAS